MVKEEKGKMVVPLFFVQIHVINKESQRFSAHSPPPKVNRGNDIAQWEIPILVGVQENDHFSNNFTSIN